MSLWVCLDCTAAYSVGAPLCPQCGSERHAEEHEAAALGVQHGPPIDTEENGMPKSTVHSGASVAGGETGTDTTASDEAEGGEDVSAGVDTSTSSERPPTSPETNETGQSKPARKTASRSGRARTGSSTAPSTGGDQTEATSETGADGNEG